MVTLYDFGSLVELGVFEGLHLLLLGNKQQALAEASIEKD
jgi:hypothetical protein